MKYRWIIAVLLLCVGGLIAAAQEGETDTPETLLLKDYRPESAYQIPQTQVDRARYPAIDMHSHDVRQDGRRDRPVGQTHGRGRD